MENIDLSVVDTLCVLRSFLTNYIHITATVTVTATATVNVNVNVTAIGKKPGPLLAELSRSRFWLNFHDG